MNWITSYVRPRLNSMLGRRETPENLWIKCPESGEMVFHRDVEANQWVIPNSGHHMKISARERLGHFYDEGRFTEIENPEVAQDPLKFRDQKKYADRLRDNRANIRMAGGEQLSVTGFQVIDEAKFNALPDDVFADWRKKGWLALVYCQLLSTGSWATLIDSQADHGITSAGIADDTEAKETENAA